MKGISRFAGICVLPLAGLSIAACMPFLEGDSWQSSPPVGARPVQTDLRSSLGYYEKAVAAINNRHYALALEYLQAARNQKPDDVRVLTAFGVIYDKLGRFDLSARYYSQAAALEPNSRIIAADMDYSRKLQGISGSGPVAVAANANPGRVQDAPPPAVAMAEAMVPAPMMASEPNLDSMRPVQSESRGRVADISAPPAAMTALPSDRRVVSEPNLEPMRPVQSENRRRVADISAPPAAMTALLSDHPVVIVDASGRSETGQPAKSYLSGWSIARDDGANPRVAGRSPRPAAKAVFLTGHPMTIVDASGRNEMGKSVRTYLSGLGWTVAKEDGVKMSTRSQTTIVYKETMITAAKALARTLSLPMRLSANDSVEGLQLVLGSDVSARNLAARPPSRQRQLALAVSKPIRE
jgi:hypothetical protein